MGESHCRHRKFEERRIFKILVETEGTADNERNGTVLHRNLFGKETGKRNAVELFSFDTEGNERAFDMFSNQFGFLSESLLNFLIGRVIGKADSRELNEIELAEGCKAFGVDILRLNEVRFFLFADSK